TRQRAVSCVSPKTSRVISPMASNRLISARREKSVVALLVNNTVGSPRLNTSFDAVLINSSVITPSRRNTIPMMTIRKMGAVTEEAKLNVAKADESGTIYLRPVIGLMWFNVTHIDLDPIIIAHHDERFRVAALCKLPILNISATSLSVILIIWVSRDFYRMLHCSRGCS